MRWLAYAHPVLMVGVLALGLLVLREGLGVRRGRIARRPADSRRHRRLARIFVLLLVAGYASGIASMAWLRDAPPFLKWYPAEGRNLDVTRDVPWRIIYEIFLVFAREYHDI